jgi:AcrR family transcriptional regulator
LDRQATGQRDRIVELALELMAERGARGMSMRDLAAAAGMNVASLYHYFPSKQELLAAVIEQSGHADVLSGQPPPVPEGVSEEEAIAALLWHSWEAMLGVEGYVRVMIGEALRHEAAATTVGTDLRARTHASLEQWVKEATPGLCDALGAAPLARLLETVLVGVFIDHVTAPGATARTALRRRAEEVAHLLCAGR